MNLKEVGDKLSTLGWKGGAGEIGHAKSDAQWYRKFHDITPVCKCNNSIQIVIEGWDNSIWGDIGLRFEMDLTAECRDERWVKLLLYSIPNEYDLFENLDSFCNKLILAWKACNTNG